MGPETSQVNYCRLMDAGEGGVIVFSFTPTGETTWFQWIVSHPVMLVALVTLSRSQHKTKQNQNHEYEKGICKRGEWERRAKRETVG